MADPGGQPCPIAGEHGNFLTGGGKVGTLMRAHDWSGSPLGAPESWPQSLRSVVGLLLSSKFPMFVAWGDKLTFLYNDSYAEILGAKHPEALGARFQDIWSEIWPDISPLIDAAMAGEATYREDLPLVMNRRGFDEQTWFTFSYSPVRDESGAVAGMFCAVAETTDKVLAQDRLAQQKERQQLLFERAPGFIAILNGPDHVFEFANEAYVRLVGDRDLIGKTVRDAFPEVEGQGLFEMLDRGIASGERFFANQVPISLRRSADGIPETRILDFIYEPVLDETGRATGIFVEGYDVTERTRAEAALAASEARYRQIVEGADDFAIIAIDQHGIITSWNSGAERLLGYAEAEAVGQSADIFFSPEDRAAGMPAQEMSRTLSDGRAINERWHVRKDGTSFWGSGLMMRCEGDGAGFIKMFRDRTAEHEAEQQLRQSEQRFRALAEAIGEVFYLSDLRTRKLIYVSESYEKIWGRQVSELFERDWAYAEAIHPEDQARARAAYEAQAHGKQTEVEYRIVRPDGITRWIQDRSFPIRDGEGRPIQAAGLAQDITERRQSEAALARSEEQLRLAIDAADIGLWDVDTVEDTLFWPPRVKAMFGISRDRPVTMDDFYAGLHPDDARATASAFAAAADPENRALYDVEYRTIGKEDGALRWVAAKGRGVFDSSGCCLRVIGTAIDITKRKAIEERLHELNEMLEARVAERTAELIQAQEALRQSQKLEAMGQLTGGVAHDFNNLLTPIIGSLDLLHRRGVGSEREQRLIEGALQSADRSKTLVQRLLAFARRQPLQPRPVDVGALVQGMADLIASTSGPQTKVAVDVTPDCPAAIADPNQLEMAILNLSVNARDAMPDGGRLSITVGCDRVEADHHSGLPPGLYVRLSVADTGAGMNADTMARAIEPFFSTKGVGKGTGLGLSMVHGLVKQLGGTLLLSSRVGLGTEVEFWLPATEERVRSDENPSQGDTPSSTGRALLVDDEELVRASTADMLADMGYDVVEAGSAEEALRHLFAGERFDLLVTDHLMPGMNGTDLARAALSRDADLPVLVISGYAELDGIAPDLPRLTKPFRQAELAEALGAVAG